MLGHLPWPCSCPATLHWTSLHQLRRQRQLHRCFWLHLQRREQIMPSLPHLPIHPTLHLCGIHFHPFERRPICASTDQRGVSFCNLPSRPRGDRSGDLLLLWSVLPGQRLLHRSCRCHVLYHCQRHIPGALYLPCTARTECLQSS